MTFFSTQKIAHVIIQHEAKATPATLVQFGTARLAPLGIRLPEGDENGPFILFDLTGNRYYPAITEASSILIANILMATPVRYRPPERFYTISGGKGNQDTLTLFDHEPVFLKYGKDGKITVYHEELYQKWRDSHQD